MDSGVWVKLRQFDIRGSQFAGGVRVCYAPAARVSSNLVHQVAYDGMHGIFEEPMPTSGHTGVWKERTDVGTDHDA